MATPFDDDDSGSDCSNHDSGSDSCNQDEATRTSIDDDDSGSDYEEGKLTTGTAADESIIVLDRDKANTAYLSVINTLKSGLQDTTLLLCEDNQTGSNYRGILLGRSWGTGATVDEFITGRVQHDVNCSELDIFIKAAQAHRTVLASLSNKGIIDQLCKTVQVLLKKYSIAEQMKFTSGKNQVNPAVVAALFNVGRRKNICMSEFGIKFETRIKMIDQCLFLCHPNKVTAAIAKQVYDQYVGRPKGAQLKTVDLKEFTKEFGILVDKLMSKGYLDITMSITNPDHQGVAGEGRREAPPTVEVYMVTTEQATPTKSFSVIVVNNFVSPTFQRQWMKRINELSFTVGKGGKSGAFIRNCSTTKTPAPMLIGRKHVYQGVVPDEMEADILNMAIYLAKQQQTMIENLHGSYKVTWHCNLVHTVVAAIYHSVYASHSDANPTLCSNAEAKNDPHVHVKDNLYLPKPDEMQVVTMVFSNCEDKFSTELVYTDVNSKKVIQTIPLSSCCLHWQGPGSQAAGILHRAKVIPGINAGGIYRIASTFRFTLDPIENKDKFDQRLCRALQINNLGDRSEWTTQYTEQGVIDRCTNCPFDTGTKINSKYQEDDISASVQTQQTQMAGTQLQQLVEDGSFIDLHSKSLTDGYNQLPYERYKTYVSSMKSAKIRLEGTMAEELSSAYAVKKLFDAGYLLEVQSARGKRAVPCLHQIKVNRIQEDVLSENGNDMVMPVPGKYYHLSGICAEAGLIHKTRSRRIYNPKAGTQGVIVLSQSYKNDVVSIRNYLRRLDERETFKGRVEFFDDNFDGTIWIHGSGGSPSFPGSIPPDADVSSKHDPLIVIPRSQLLKNPLNMALMEMVMYSAVVTIYVNEAMFEGNKDVREDIPANNPDLCRCLGVFCAEQFVMKKDEVEEVVDSHRLDDTTSQKFARYKLAPYLKFEFKPVLSNQNLEEIWAQAADQCSRKKKKTICIPFDCSDHLEADIPLGGVSEAASLTPGKMILRTTIIDQFVKSADMMSRYTVQDSDDITARQLMEKGDISNMEQEDTLKKQEDDDATEEISEDYISANTDDCIEKGMKADMNSLISAVCFCSMAGAYRYKRECFEWVEGKQYARPLLIDCYLPEVFRIHPLPMPNRALDIISIGLRAELECDGTFLRCQTNKASRIKYRREYNKDLVGTVFKSIILRFTGRLNSFLQYSIATNKVSMLPSLAKGELEAFLSFVGCTSKGPVKRIPRWISDQHAHSIPKETKYYTGFVQFLTTVAQEIENVVNKMLVVDDDESDQRYLATIQMRDMLQQCSQTRDNQRMDFLAHQVLSDVEEIFDDPFGKVTPNSVHAGSGAEQGFKMLRNNKDTASPHDLNHALEIIIEHMGEKTTNVNLEMMGYETWASRSKREVRNKVNGRPFSATDAEHFLCKLWVISKYTLPAYSTAIQPTATKPHCHPINLRGRKNSPDPIVSEIMASMLRGNEQSRKEMTAPPFCLLPNEIRIVPEASKSNSAIN